ncbi:MAG: peptidoglycan DD-metalloendopeptidase family protein [Ignavibacteriaceae bacterium]|nr:peptidoglycan DD-metalloendopeptidase family protein [Ignavibacteriaceae bacterium]
MVARLKISLIFFLLSSLLIDKSAQNNSQISSKQKELNIIKGEISKIEKEIQNKSKKEKETYQLLQKYDKQTFLLNKIIANYRNDINEKENTIADIRKKNEELTKKINQLQTDYAKYVKAVYKKKIQSDLALIFNSESLSQALSRIFYLKRFSDRRRKDLDVLEKSRIELAASEGLIKKELEVKNIVVNEKIEEENSLKKKTIDRRKVLNTIKRDRKALLDELNAKKKAEVVIKNLIAKLNSEKIKRENENKLRNKVAGEKKLMDKNTESVSLKKNLTSPPVNLPKNIPNNQSPVVFQQLKGKLMWPINGGRIIRRFGENKNFSLNTVTLNYGVDIKAGSDFKVKSVASGVVSAIEWIPGYGSIIIISHNDDFRTVYSHLNEILVIEGNTVNAGQPIASVGETIEGNILHFEVWNSRENLNPEIWLAKK